MLRPFGYPAEALCLTLFRLFGLPCLGPLAYLWLPYSQRLLNNLSSQSFDYDLLNVIPDMRHASHVIYLCFYMFYYQLINQSIILFSIVNILFCIIMYGIRAIIYLYQHLINMKPNGMLYNHDHGLLFSNFSFSFENVNENK